MLTSGLGERSGENAGYSKFFNPQKAFMPVRSRTGMCVIYAAGTVLSIAWLCDMLANGRAGGSREVLTAVLLVGHYVKRELEVFFVHQYSGSTDLAAAAMISCFYGLCAWGILSYTPSIPLSPGVTVCACMLYIIGQAGNGYHHWLLSQLRSNKTEKKYTIPTAACFHYVTCPHYFYELVSWWAVAFVSGSLFGFLNFGSMVHYLSGRSWATSKWYKEKFGAEFPAVRKHMVPFVY